MCPDVRASSRISTEGTSLFKRILRIFVIILVLAVLVIVVGGIVGFNFLRDNGIKQYFATMKPPAATVSTTIAKP